MGLTTQKVSESDAYVISVVSLVITGVACVVGISVSIIANSAALFAFGLENMVDSISSALVIWRFYGGGKAAGLTPEKLALREKRASVAIAFTMVLLGIVVGGLALSHLAEGNETSQNTLLIGLAVPSLVVFGVLGAIKFHYGSVHQLNSPALRKDAACSISGSVISFGVALGAIMVHQGVHSAWFIDATVALIVALVLGGMGAFSMVKNARVGNRWWTVRWWTTEPTGRDEQTLTVDSRMALSVHNRL